jgi:protein O-mannosyl-transferase
MAKKPELKKKAQPKASKFILPELHGRGWLFANNFVFQAILIVLVSGIFYANTYNNEYALDDDIIMRENMYVQEGIPGIGDIMSNDAYKSYYASMGVEQQLEGGRYRPLSIVTFAIEQQIFGECYGDRATEVRDSVFFIQRKRDSLNSALGSAAVDQAYYRLMGEKNTLTTEIKKSNLAIAPVRHAFQVFWFALSMVVLLWFLRECIFRSNTDIAFLAALLFAIHPIHTEVIANVKSRDEIFSLMFICLTFIFYLRYDLKKNNTNLALLICSFLGALLSKEYGVMLFILLPLFAVVYRKRTLSSQLAPMLAVVGVLVFYFGLRAAFIPHAQVNKSTQDPLNDPYLYANAEQRLASILNRLDDYLYLLIFPKELAADYSYQHFPYSRFSNFSVWVSVFVNIGLAFLALYFLAKRHIMGFALAFYFAFFILINNVFFDIGATMGERLIYHSSLGFCMALAWLIIKGLEKVFPARAENNTDAFGAPRSAFAPQAIALTLIFLLLAAPAFVQTVNRNAEWKNDFTLFTTDVKTHPNSALTNGNAGARYMDKGLTYVGRDTMINDSLIKGYGRDTVKLHRYADTAIVYLRKATQLHKKYVNGFLNLGLCYYYKENYALAAEAWGNAFIYFPSNPILMGYEQMLLAKANEFGIKKDYARTAEFLGYAVTAMPNDAQTWSNYAGASFMAKDFETAKMAFQKAMNLKPDLQPQLTNGYRAADNNAIKMKAYETDSNNVAAIVGLAEGYTGTVEFYAESRRLLQKALVLQPENPRAAKLLDSLGTLETAAKIPPAGKLQQ